MKYNVTDIEFDFDEGDIDDPITFEEQVQIRHDNLGIWEADNENCNSRTTICIAGWLHFPAAWRPLLQAFTTAWC